ncbi:hypothetical protein VitviT2T_029640 [Vitis vinifera]|uniref:GAG-pre-integrase domain-containing protein n=1 Tax=Vitis vinifera TaxID=29760 RepID=A0ABY9DXA7_VITVI|nr:hypothetical protein VitviT2T_029640 [Vitis vinifera]
MKGYKTISSAISVRSLGMFREIATNVGHGLRRKGFLTIQTLNQNESSIVVGNGVKVPVVATGTFRLFLDTDCYLDLFQTFYIPSISRNLVSMSKLDLEGYSFSFHNRRFSLFKNSSFVGSGSLCDGLYKLNLNSCFTESLLTLHHNVGTKRNLINESSSYLWHRRLGHISKERMKRLVKDGILPNLDFTDLDVCVDRDGNGASFFEYLPRLTPNGTGFNFNKWVWEFF